MSWERGSLDEILPWQNKYHGLIQIYTIGLFSRRILEENEPDYYSGKFFFFRQTTECMRSGHFLQNY